MLSTNIYSSEIICKDSTTKNPPFYISDTYRKGDLIYEKLRDINDGKSKHPKEAMSIAKGSIVYVDIALNDSSPNAKYLPVQVLSTPNKKLNKEVFLKRTYGRKDNFNNLLGKSNYPTAITGSVGYIRKKALRHARKYRFVVTKDTKLYKTINPRDFPNINLLLDMTPNNRYKIEQCCYLQQNSTEKICFKKYKYIVYSGQDEVSRASISQGPCVYRENLIPIETSKFKIFDRIISTLYLDYQDLTYLPQYKKDYEIKRPPLIKLPVDSLENVFHYLPDNSKSTDLFALPTVVCALSNALKAFSKKCNIPGCQVQIGDMYHSTDWKEHKFHQSGKCFDIRPLRKDDDKNTPLDIYNSRYDREKTCQLMKTLQDFGVTYIEFAGKLCPDVWSQKNKNFKDHLNHLHVCFNNVPLAKKRGCNQQ